MSLSKFLQCEEVLNCTREGNPEILYDKLQCRGNQWFSAHPEEILKIKNNLEAFGINADTEMLSGFQHNLILHYYEKLLGICLPPEQFRHILKTQIVESDLMIETLMSSLNSDRAVLLASSHFGAVEFIAPFLASYGLVINTVLKFKTEALAELSSKRAAQLMSEAHFGKISFIQIGRPGTVAAMDMAAALRRKEILLNIFDEKTEYSKKVSLFGRSVWGGAGVDKIIRFCGTALDVFTIFMIRIDNNKYRLHLDRIENFSSSDVLLSSMYSSLENVVGSYPQQWYFLHEDIPYAE